MYGVSAMLDNEKLYELMEEKDIKSKMELSRRTKIPYSTLIYMFQGHDMQVSTMIELSKFFNVPIDHLVSKSYGIVSYTQDKVFFINTSSIIEATVSSMM